MSAAWGRTKFIVKASSNFPIILSVPKMPRASWKHPCCGVASTKNLRLSAVPELENALLTWLAYNTNYGRLSKGSLAVHYSKKLQIYATTTYPELRSCSSKFLLITLSAHENKKLSFVSKHLWRVSIRWYDSNCTTKAVLTLSFWFQLTLHMTSGMPTSLAIFSANCLDWRLH